MVNGDIYAYNLISMGMSFYIYFNICIIIQDICIYIISTFRFIADLLQKTGGIFVGYNTILSRPLPLDDDFQGRLVSSYEGYATSVIGATPLPTKLELLRCLDEKYYSSIRSDDEVNHFLRVLFKL